jgi:hypothetical protein
MKLILIYALAVLSTVSIATAKNPKHRPVQDRDLSSGTYDYTDNRGNVHVVTWSTDLDGSRVIDSDSIVIQMYDGNDPR